MNEQQQRSAIAMRVSRWTLWVNGALSVLKLLAGILGHSGAMISDAVHSASDVLSTVVVMVGIRLAEQESDSDHEYGHERLECIAALILGAMLALTGVGIGAKGLEKLRAAESLAVPGMMALATAVLSIVVKEIMFRYTRRAAEKISSPSLLADAWHHRSDALSSVGALVGIAGARLGYPILEPLATLVICCFIWKASYDILREAVAQLTDRSCAKSVEEEMAQVVGSVKGVEHIDLLRTRQFGSRVYVDVEIAVEGTLSLWVAHDIAEQVHDAVESGFPAVKHCMVHVNPWKGCQKSEYLL